MPAHPIERNAAKGDFPLRKQSIVSTALSLLVAGAVLCGTVVAPVVAATGAVTYTYDALGRLRTALYDTGVCITYQYDPNGNRTQQTVNVGGAPLTATWGVGTWGCFSWQ